MPLCVSCDGDGLSQICDHPTRGADQPTKDVIATRHYLSVMLAIQIVIDQNKELQKCKKEIKTYNS